MAKTGARQRIFDGQKDESGRPPEMLRHLRQPLISVECAPCGLRQVFDRKVLVKQYGASVPLDRLRRRMAMGCDRMVFTEGVDRCQTRLIGLSQEQLSGLRGI